MANFTLRSVYLFAYASVHIPRIRRWSQVKALQFSTSTGVKSHRFIPIQAMDSAKTLNYLIHSLYISYISYIQTHIYMPIYSMYRYVNIYIDIGWGARLIKTLDW